jgi:hypothetical protein
MGCGSSKTSQPKVADKGPVLLGPQATEGPPKKTTIPEAHQEVLRTFAANMQDAERLKTLVVNGFWFSAPGTPQLPVEQLAGMMSVYAGAFPDWKCVADKIKLIKETEDQIEYHMHTRHRMGTMQADLPEVGPFPGVSLKEAPERIKTQPVALPVEKGIYVIDKATGKLVSCSYQSELGETGDATSEARRGLLCLYKLLGKKVPRQEEQSDTSPKAEAFARRTDASPALEDNSAPKGGCCCAL